MTSSWRPTDQPNPGERSAQTLLEHCLACLVVTKKPYVSVAVGVQQRLDLVGDRAIRKRELQDGRIAGRGGGFGDV